MTRVALIFGGRSVEHRVSITSARTVARALRASGHQVIPLGIAQDGCWIPRGESRAALNGAVDVLAPRATPPARSLRHLVTAPADVVFPLVHGTWGEDGTLQGLCEMLDLPYVGAGVTASALAMDKLLCKRQLDSMGLPVVPFAACSRAELEASPEWVHERFSALVPPLFVKPSVGGSSVGIRKIERPEDLPAALAHAFAFDDTALVEQGVVGRELECSVLGYGRLEASEVGEIVPGNAFYDYADKYLQERARLLAPADLPREIADRVRDLAVRAFHAIGGWGMARVDFFLATGGVPFINEINTVPGFTNISMYPRLWELSGLPLPRLVDRLIEIAAERHRDRRRLDEGIKLWLEDLER